MLTLALCLVAPLQTTWHVDSAGTAPGSGTAADPYTRVDYAVAQATTLAGDTVLVEPGIYANEAIDFAGKDLVVRSTGGPQNTVLEGLVAPTFSAPILRLASGESLSSRLEGFTLAAQAGDWVNGFEGQGGAIYCEASDVTLQNLIIRQSTIPHYGPAEQGAGIYVAGGTLEITDSVFEDLAPDISLNFGGGIYATQSDVRLTDCTMQRCAATQGAGIYATSSSINALGSTFKDAAFGSQGGAGGAMALFNSSLVMLECEVTGNRPGYEGAGILAESGSTLDVRDSLFANNRDFTDPYRGAGIHMATGVSATVTGSTFRGNEGQFGAAIYGAADIMDCLFENNVAYGAGQYGCGGGAISGSGTVTRSIFSGNTATDTFTQGGGAIRGTWAVDHCTFVNNTALNSNGTLVPSTAAGEIAISNSIIRGGTAPRISPTLGAATYSNIEGGFLGQGNFDLPESFWPDFALLPDSPSIDSADPAAPLDADGTRSDRGAIPFDAFRCEAGCAGSLGTSICNANPNSTGQGAVLTALGDSTVSENRFVLNVTDSPAGSLGFFLASQTTGNQMLGGGSQGLLCLGGNILRFSNTVLDDRGVGVVSSRPDLSAFPQGNMVMAGETWNFQYWFRDANPQSTSNTSSALSVVFQ